MAYYNQAHGDGKQTSDGKDAHAFDYHQPSEDGKPTPAAGAKEMELTDTRVHPAVGYGHAPPAPASEYNFSNSSSSESTFLLESAINARKRHDWSLERIDDSLTLSILWFLVLNISPRRFPFCSEKNQACPRIVHWNLCYFWVIYSNSHGSVVWRRM